MKVERFICGLFKKVGYKTVYSPGAKKLLKKESLEILRNLRLKKGLLADVVTMHFPSEDVVTRSYLTASNDDYGRDGWVNRTFVLSISEFFHAFPEVLNEAFNFVKDPFLLSPVSSETKQLSSITIGEQKMEHIE